MPRKLPSCAHSFCEACILKYTTTLVENKEDGTPTELPCPLCREVNHVPTNNADVGQWVTSLELNEELVKSVETESQKDTPELCVRCKESSRPVAASKYCFDCQEHLRERCCQTGHGFKLLRNHSVIEIPPEDSDKKQKQLIESISVYTLCKRHPEKKLRFICVEEDKLWCDICKDMIHNTCRGIIEIKEYVTKNNITEEVPKLKDKLSSLSYLSKLLILRKNENEASNKTDTQTILEKLQTMRQNMNQVLDALEDNVREQCKALAKKCALADQEDISKLQELVKTFDISSKMLDNALKQAPLDLTFIILHEMQSSNEYQETTILEFQHNFKRFGLEIASLDELLQKIQALSPNLATN